jgi:predicted phage tail protein
VELIILGGIIVLAFVYNVSFTLFNLSRGVMPWHWDRQCQTEAIGLWAAVIIAATVIFGFFFGAVALLSMWPFWLMLLIMSGAWFGVGELLARHNERKATRQTLDARLAELRQQGPLPPWAASIEARRGQAGHRKPGLLERIDRWL